MKLESAEEDLLALAGEGPIHQRQIEEICVRKLAEDFEPDLRSDFWHLARLPVDDGTGRKLVEAMEMVPENGTRHHSKDSK
jgi:hypothetical protein